MGEVTRARINFTVSEDQSGAELGGSAPVVWNAIADSAGVLRRRPAIVAWDGWKSGEGQPIGAPAYGASYGSSGSPVVAIIPWKDFIVYVTADRYIHALSALGVKYELSTGSAATTLDGGKRPNMLAGRDMLVIAGGGAIQKWEGSDYVARLASDAPPAASVCAIGRRLVAQPPNDSGVIWWSGPLDQWGDWDLATEGASYFQAAAKQDKVVRVADNTNELFAFGTETVQVLAPSGIEVDPYDSDNVLDFAPMRTLNAGTLSPDSVVAVDDVFAFLDSKRRFILSDARTMTVISKPISSLLHGLSRVDDCWGFRMRFGRFDAIVWFFPTDNVGLIWDADTNRWSEWHEGSTGNNDLSITAACDWTEQGLFLVGLSDGSIAKLDQSASADAAAPISIELRSGFSDRGTYARKACRGAVFQFRRTWDDLPAGTSGLSPSGKVVISYRDYEGAWRTAKTVALSESKYPAVKLHSVGVYRTREWRIQYTGEDELQLVSAEEELEVLEAA